METIEDIISEMRRNGVVHDPRHFNELCDRIEEALERKNEATHSQWERAMVLEAENKNLRAECELWRKQALEENGALDVARAENEKLRAALRDELRFLKWLLKADKKWLTERAVKRIKVIEDALRKAGGESVE